MPHSGRTLPLSSELLWLLDQWQSDDRQSVPETPRPSSGIILVKDSLDGLQVFVTKQADARGVSDRNRLSFPVDTLRAWDLRKLPTIGWTSANCVRALKVSDKSRALHQFSAAARIAYAALGILFAENIDRDLVHKPQVEWRETRARLQTGEVGWSQILRERDLKLRPDLLKPWIRWINTKTQLHRFDTTFFLATIPFGQEIDFLSPNDASGTWMRPLDILDEAGDDPNRIGAVNRLIVESLSDVSTVGAAMSKIRDVHPLRPEIITEAGEYRLLLQAPKDLWRKGTLRDNEVAVGDAEDDDRTGLVSLGDETTQEDNEEEDDES